MVIMRVKSGHPFFLASMDHFALRMLRLGLSVRQVVGITYGGGIILIFISLGVSSLPSLWMWISVAGVCAVAVIWGRRLSKIDV